MNSPLAVAQEPHWYGGASVGQSRARIDDAQITSKLLSTGQSTSSITDDNRDFGYKLLGGYKFNRNFAVEGGYFNLGEFGFTSTTTPTGSLSGRLKVHGLNLDAVGTLPLANDFSLFGRVGVQFAKTEDNFSSTGQVVVLDSNPSTTQANLKIGAGVQYDVGQHGGLSVRAEWERYRINDAVGSRGGIDLVSVGLIYLFGKEPVQVAAVAPPPRIIEVAPPVLVIVPIPPVRTERYCSILDLNFEINKSTVQRESDEKIDTLVTFMRKYPNTTAVIEGHSDEVGPTADNMILSQRRADSVVSYLAGHGIDRSRLKAIGFGETRPIADNKTEVGKRLNRRVDAIIACATDIEGLTPRAARVTMALEMEYDTDKAEVRPAYREELRKVANFMKANPGVTATVEGHTSDRKNVGPGAEMAISKARAQNVVNYLVDNFDIARSRLSAEGYGTSRRFAYNTSLEGQRENRRINIILDFPN
jgi:OOP family OmpA-OmpF porin